MIHHGSIRKYTEAIINLFNEVEVQYKMSTGETINKNVPIKYSSREKSRILDEHTEKQILSGNFNVLPRATLAWNGLSKHVERTQNKNIKINQFRTDTAVEYSFNSIPYDFTYDLIFQCRGMNEATQIIEQIAPHFNPTVNIDVWDVQNLSEPTRIPLRLLDISIETEDFEAVSSNIITVVFNLGLTGNLYQPIKSEARVNEFEIYMNTIQDDSNATKEEMLAWDVDQDGNVI